MVAVPVCGMRIDTDDAAASVEYEGETYYFCSVACREAFVARPDSYGAVAMAGQPDMR
jgi:YHS domain-containing protein